MEESNTVRSTAFLFNLEIELEADLLLHLCTERRSTKLTRNFVKVCEGSLARGIGNHLRGQRRREREVEKAGNEEVSFMEDLRSIV